MPFLGMGTGKARFDGPATKAQLKMCTSRAKIMKNKNLAATKVLQKEVAILLKEGQESRAKIKAEQILQNINLSDALDLLDTMAELLATRMSFIQEQKDCPQDLVETVSTVIYADDRCPVEELKKIVEAFRSKYGETFVNPAKSGTTPYVHPRMIQLLSVRPPTDQEMLSILKDAATYFRVDWDSKVMEEEIERKKQILEDQEARQLQARMMEDATQAVFNMPVAAAGPGYSSYSFEGDYARQQLLLPQEAAAPHDLQHQHQREAQHPQHQFQSAPPSMDEEVKMSNMIVVQEQQEPQYNNQQQVKILKSSAAAPPSSRLLESLPFGQTTAPFVMAVIPPGYLPGMVLPLRTPTSEKSLEITIPPGGQPGQILQIPLNIIGPEVLLETSTSSTAATTTTSTQPASTTTTSRPGAATRHQEGLGQPCGTTTTVTTSTTTTADVAAARSIINTSTSIGEEEEETVKMPGTSVVANASPEDLDDLMARFNALKHLNN